MAFDINNPDDGEDGKLEWTKLSKTAPNSGYKEGITEARDSAFQNCFDSGYEMGTNMGMKLGFYQALQRKCSIFKWYVTNLGELHLRAIQIFINLIHEETVSTIEDDVKTTRGFGSSNILSKEAEECLAKQESSLLLKKPALGHCQICINQSLLENNLTDVANIQKECNALVKETLKNKYSVLIKELRIEEQINT